MLNSECLEVFNKYLIEMEDISRYMITNKISSLKEAIGDILECNGLEGELHLGDSIFS